MEKNLKNFIVGLTGGICSGKSTAANVFKDLGITVINADMIGHHVLQINGGLVVDMLGEQVLTNGVVDRNKVRNMAFKRKNILKCLEKALHPFILYEIECQHEESTTPYTVLECALIIEKKIKVDRILGIYIDKETQIKRVIERDGYDKELTRKIINLQVSKKKLLNESHDVVPSGFGFDHVKNRINLLHKKYMGMANGNK